MENASLTVGELSSASAPLLQSGIASAIVGGLLIGLAATWLYLSIGRIAGISGIAARAISFSTFSGPLKNTLWPLLFVLGLGLGGWLANLLLPGVQSGSGVSSQLPNYVEQLGQRWPWLIVGGVLVGFGTRLGSGCTSGHGVCGIARISPRSLAATCVFLGVGMVVATLLQGLRI